MDKIETFFKNIGDEREFTGEVAQTVLDGEAEVRISVYEDDSEGHRNGTFQLLLKTTEDPEDILKNVELLRLSELEPDLKPIENQVRDLIDEHCGYNPYEPLLDIAEEKFNEAEFDIVAYDSFVVFD